MKQRLDARWRRETAFHLSILSAALDARSRWDSANASLWHQCTDLLATASRALQQDHKPPPEWRLQFNRAMIRLRTEADDDPG